MLHSSRIPGFYKLSLEERHAELSRRTHIPAERISEVTQGGLDSNAADKVVENVLGVYCLPLGVALNVTLNGQDRLAPMVVEEPSVIAAASNAARMIRAGGGFEARNVGQLMIGQVQLWGVSDLEKASNAITQAEPELLRVAALAVPNLVRRGGGPVALKLRPLAEGMLVVHVHVDCKDAMGANLVNNVAEALGPELARLAQAKLGLRILSNLCDERRVYVRARVPASELVMARPREVHSGTQTNTHSSVHTSWAPELPRDEGGHVVDAIARASRFAELDPYRAATHNKGIMNGVDSVVIATGNDYRAVEAGAHAYAARSGRYQPLATWKRVGEDLVGELEMPLALGIVGGTLRIHPTARFAIELSRVGSADELALLAAAVGLASNLAALRALATEGIQRGHMSLHARSVASAAGALGAEVELVAAALSEGGVVTVDQAYALLLKLRGA